MTLPRISRRQLRLGSGLVLFSYLALHFTDHALGLVSLALAEQALALAVAVWRSLPGTVLLYGAALVHIALALIAVYERRTLRMPPAQALRIALGLGMPLMVIGHVVATRLAADAYGLAPSYARVVHGLWLSGAEGRQLAMLAPGWLHGCLGLHYAFGHRAAWRRLRPVALGAALLLPVLAALGYVSMGRELARADPGAAGLVAAASAAQSMALGRLREELLQLYLALVAGTFVLRALRAEVQRRRHQLVTIGYPQRVVAVPRGWSVLEASRGHGIPHLSHCGGQGRCSTCRVRVVEGHERCPPPAAQERRTLARIQAGADVRLACQLRPWDGIAVQQLLEVVVNDEDVSEAVSRWTERDCVLLVVALRLRPAREGDMPSAHDLGYALERVHGVVGAALAGKGGLQGRADTEGADATFGLAGDPAKACRQALEAARAIESGLDALNARLGRDFGLVADFAQAAHAGAVVIGSLGRGTPRTRLAVGATVLAAQALRDQALASGARWAWSREMATTALGERAGQDWQTLVVPATGLALAMHSSARVPLPEDS